MYTRCSEENISHCSGAGTLAVITRGLYQTVPDLPFETVCVCVCEFHPDFSVATGELAALIVFILLISSVAAATAVKLCFIGAVKPLPIDFCCHRPNINGGAQLNTAAKSFLFC